MTRQPQQWAEENSEQIHRALDAADAGAMVQTLVQARVPFRNSVAEELHKWYDEDNDSPFEESVETAQRLGGGFFQKVYAGDYAGAYLHADSNNQRIIEQEYNEQFIVDNADSGYDGRIVQERWG